MTTLQKSPVVIPVLNITIPVCFPLDKVNSVVKELKEKGYGEYDMSYDYEGTTIDGIDAAWCDNIADTKVYSESEFDLINLDKELSFIEKGEPYISVPFTEGSSSDYKHCHIEGGTIYGLVDDPPKIAGRHTCFKHNNSCLFGYLIISCKLFIMKFFMHLCKINSCKQHCHLT